MADTETLRREFEVAYLSTESAVKDQEFLRWNECESHYTYEPAHSLFLGFCICRQASQAEIERLKQFEKAYDLWMQKTEWVQDQKKWTFPSFGKHRADVMRLEIERLQSDLKLHSKRADDSKQTCIELMAEIERLQSIVDRVPKFANGEPALTGDEAWYPGIESAGSVANNRVAIWDLETWVPIARCYPTREAMEKASP